MKTASVIIPAHNEQAAVRKVLGDVMHQGPALEALGYELEIILVANACTDDTVAEAHHISDVYDFPIILIEEERKGYGYAHRRGIAAARGDVLLSLDCDDTYPAHVIPRMVQMLDEDVSFVTTDRLRLEPSMSIVSRLGNFLLSAVSTILTGQRLSDSQSGMWGYRREHIADLLQGIGTGMELSEQLKLRLARAAVSWTCLNIEYNERVGESKLNPISDGFRCLWHLVRT